MSSVEVQLISSAELDFSTSGSKSWYQRDRPDEDGDVWMRHFNRCTARYCREDLYQNREDPACNCGPDWPLATYWPVYLDNFFVHEWDEDRWYDQISDYFAHKGLVTRMMYFHTADEEFWLMQEKCSLVDALVYFCSEEDARRAISTCHRDLYCGHRLNVLPGRVAEYLDNERSARFKHFAKNAVFRTEAELDSLLNTFGEVEFCVRHFESRLFVQFKSQREMLDAISSQDSWKPIMLKYPVRKQRFLEEDAIQGLRWVMDSKEGFFDQKPRPAILQYFFDGVIPIVDTTWKGHSRPKYSSQLLKTRTDKRLRNKRNQRKLLERHLAERKKALLKPAKDSVDISQDVEDEAEGDALDDGTQEEAPPTDQPKGKSVTQCIKEQKNEVLNSINYMLHQHGRPRISMKQIKTTQNEWWQAKRTQLPIRNAKNN